jgi:hypothetical protein
MTPRLTALVAPAHSRFRADPNEQQLNPFTEKESEPMSYIGPVTLPLMVLLPVLIPLVTAVWHTVAGTERRIEQRRVVIHSRLQGLAIRPASRDDDGIGLGGLSWWVCNRVSLWALMIRASTAARQR